MALPASSVERRGCLSVRLWRVEFSRLLYGKSCAAVTVFGCLLNCYFPLTTCFVGFMASPASLISISLHLSSIFIFAYSEGNTSEVMDVIGLEESLVSLTITIYLLMSVLYTSAPKARYRYRLEITSSSSARYFTRWFESR